MSEAAAISSSDDFLTTSESRNPWSRRHRFRRYDERPAVATTAVSTPATYASSFFSLSAICSGLLSWVKLAVNRPCGSIT